MLTDAIGCKHDALLFSYCQSVLKKGWIMECNHGGRILSPAIDTTEKWHELGPMDPIKAILVENE